MFWVYMNAFLVLVNAVLAIAGILITHKTPHMITLLAIGWCTAAFWGSIAKYKRERTTA